MVSGQKIVSVVVLLGCLAYIHALTAEDRASIGAAMNPYVKTCSGKHGITEKQYIEGRRKGTTDGFDPCFFSCLLKKTGVFNGQGKFDLEKSIAFGQSNIKSARGMEAYTKVATTCARVNDIDDGEDGCVRAKAFYDCVDEQMRELNLR